MYYMHEQLNRLYMIGIEIDTYLVCGGILVSDHDVMKLVRSYIYPRPYNYI